MTLIRSDEAAALLRVSVAAARALAVRDQWRRVRLGRGVGYELDDVAETLLRRQSGARRRTTTSERIGA